MDAWRTLGKLVVVVATSALLHSQADAQTAGQATNLNIYKVVLDLQKRMLALQSVVSGVPLLAQPLSDILNELSSIQVQLNALSSIPAQLDALSTIQSQLNALSSIQVQLNALSSIQAQLDVLSTIQAQLNALSTIPAQLDALSDPTQENVRFTPFVNVTGANEVAKCNLLNVSGAAQTVRAELIQLAGGANQDTTTRVVNPGSAIETNPVACIACYCRFTVVDGSRTAIRGALQVLPPGGHEKFAIAAE